MVLSQVLTKVLSEEGKSRHNRLLYRWRGCMERVTFSMDLLQLYKSQLCLNWPIFAILNPNMNPLTFLLIIAGACPIWMGKDMYLYFSVQ